MTTALYGIEKFGKVVGFTMELEGGGTYSGSNFDHIAYSREEAEKENVDNEGFGQITTKPMIPFKGENELIQYENSDDTDSKKFVYYNGRKYGHVNQLKNNKFAHQHRLHEFDSREEAAKDLISIFMNRSF